MFEKSKEELDKRREKNLAARADVIDCLEAMGDVDKQSIIRETGANVELIDGRITYLSVLRSVA